MPWAHRSSHAIANTCEGGWPLFFNPTDFGKSHLSPAVGVWWRAGWIRGGRLPGVGRSWVLEAADVPFFDTGWVEVVEEATGNLEGIAGVGFGPEFRVTEVELVHGSGDAHVEQSTFLL